MAYSARPLSTDELTKLVFQVAHGFTVGQVVTFNGANYVLSLADTLADCQAPLIISILIDANNFYVTQAGYVTGLPAVYVAGTQYYISPTVSGTLTSTEPFNVGEVIVPCFVADTTTSGYFYTNSGATVQSSGLFSWQIVSVNTSMVVNTGYIYAAAGANNLKLPTVASVGDIIRITNLGAGNFTITQSAGQSLIFGNDVTTIGAGGSTISQNPGDSIEFICTNANINFTVLSSMGNFTLV